MTKIHNISVFSPGKKESFLFDTNVLIKIFYPALGARNSAPYIKFYEQLIKQNTSLLLSSIQLSEFVNRCIRFQFDLYKKLTQKSKVSKMIIGIQMITGKVWMLYLKLLKLIFFPILQE